MLTLHFFGSEPRFYYPHDFGGAGVTPSTEEGKKCLLHACCRISSLPVAKRPSGRLTILRAGAPCFWSTNTLACRAICRRLPAVSERTGKSTNCTARLWGRRRGRTMEQLAARLRKTIVALQPDGPYRLAGWSFGGILAYEIAVQL